MSGCVQHINNIILTGRMKKLNVLLLYEWILEAWTKISIDNIIKRFKISRISNNLDGSEMMCYGKGS